MELTQCDREDWETSRDNCDSRGNEKEAGLEAELVIWEAPEDPAAAIEDVEEDCKDGVEMVIIYEGKTKGLAVGGHQSVADSNAKESQPNLQNEVRVDYLHCKEC